MVSRVDVKDVMMQLRLSNIAGALDGKQRYHVTQIRFYVKMSEDEGGSDATWDYGRPFSEEDKESLNWQPRTENCQDDSELCNLSGRLCPYKSIAFSLFDKVTDEDTLQHRIESQPLSSRRLVRFRSVMLTKHSFPNRQSGPSGQSVQNEQSAENEEVQLVFSCDGLPEDRSSLRWRSHHGFIKLVLRKARSSYQLFSVVQWDVIDMSDSFDIWVFATGHLNQNLRPRSDTSTFERQSDDFRKYYGVRRRMTRKTPWAAEVKSKKIYVGCYETPAAAARAVDVALIYHKLNLHKLNFPSYPYVGLLPSIPAGLDQKAERRFIREQAKKLWKKSETPCNRNSSQFTSCSILSDDSLEAAYNRRPTTNSIFVGSAIAGPDFLAMKPGRRELLPQTSFAGLRPSTMSLGSGFSREVVVGSSSVENILLPTSNNRFTTNSALSTGLTYPELEPTYSHEALLTRIPKRSFEASISFETTAGDANLEPDSDEDDDSTTVEVSDAIPSPVGVSDSNDFGLSQSTYRGCGFLPPGGSEQAEIFWNGDLEIPRDPDDWLWSGLNF